MLLGLEIINKKRKKKEAADKKELSQGGLCMREDNSLAIKFQRLGVENAPGQISLQNAVNDPAACHKIDGVPVDFSHGDVDAFEPIDGSLDLFISSYKKYGTHQAYTEYKGKKELREYLSEKLASFTGAPVDPKSEIIITPGTQGALFLAVGSLVTAGDKAVIVEPDYFANRKLIEFFGAEPVYVPMNWQDDKSCAGIDLAALEKAFQDKAKLFLFSNPNNPTGAVYSPAEIKAISDLAKKYDVPLIVDELYSRQILNDSISYTHLRSLPERPDSLVTIMGPSKTESLSGFRLGAAFGTDYIIARMEKLQAIVSLRAAGYCQAVLPLWFSEPSGWLEKRIEAHRRIRDDIIKVISSYDGFWARPTDGGSYLFIKLPVLQVSLKQFLDICSSRANVMATPGTEFGRHFEDYIRINFSQDHKAAVDAVDRLCRIAMLYKKG